MLDTGVVLSALLFPRGRLGWLVDAWKGADVQPLASRSTVEELLRALAYPKFGLEPEEIDLLLGEVLPWTEVVAVESGADLPECRDPDDQRFVELAVAGAADLLVSGDGDLQALGAVGTCRIVSPAELAVLLGRGEKR